MIRNKYNIVTILIYLIWITFIISTIINFDNITDAGQKGALFVGLPIVTLIITLFCLIIITITNLICKKDFYNDLLYILIPFLGLLLYTFL